MAHRNARLTPFGRRVVVDRIVVEGRRQRWLELPGALIVDLAEVTAMVRGSISSRTIVL